MKGLGIAIIVILANLAVANAGTNIQIAVDPDSGEQLYACNASIRHPAPQEEQECLNLSTGDVCNPNKSDPEQGACVCRTKRNYGDQIVAIDETGRFQSAVAHQNWVSLVSEGYSFRNKLTSIDINLGSEDLGAEFTVKFCYVGPKKKEKKKEELAPGEKPVDLSKGIYGLKVSLAGTDYARSLEATSFTYSCEYRTIEDPEAENEKDDSFSQKNSSTGLFSLETDLNFSDSEVPALCEFEFQFKERSGSRLKREAKLMNGNFYGSIRIIKKEKEKTPPSP